jgi:hypothetical protein
MSHKKGTQSKVPGENPVNRVAITCRYNAQFPLWQIFRFDRDTGEASPITNAQGSAMRPVVSPDGKKLVYATRFEGSTALRVRDLETSEERLLINNVTRDDQESRGTRDLMPGYCFMPDGKSLIVPANGKIQRVDFETGKSTIRTPTFMATRSCADSFRTPCSTRWLSVAGSGSAKKSMDIKTSRKRRRI